MRIALVIKALGNKGGGAERVLVKVAGGLVDRGHEVSVVTSDVPGGATYYPIATAIRLFQLGIGDTSQRSTLSDIRRRVSKLRGTLIALKPEVVVAFMHSSFIPTGLAMMGSGIPVVASEHIGPEHYRSRLLQRLILNLTPILCCRTAVVSEQVKQSFNSFLRSKMTVIPNPVVVTSVGSQHRAGRAHKKILLSVGRLEPQKDHAVLICAFAEIASDFPDWTLRIVGDGVLRARLEALIAELGLEKQVELAKFVATIDEEYATADLFVMPSIYESFGLATAEALLHGLPAVGFADCPGTNQLIRDGENGRLVCGANRQQALAEGLRELMANSGERVRLGGASRRWISDEFGLEAVLDTWTQLLGDVARRRHAS